MAQTTERVDLLSQHWMRVDHRASDRLTPSSQYDQKSLYGLTIQLVEDDTCTPDAFEAEPAPVKTGAPSDGVQAQELEELGLRLNHLMRGQKYDRTWPDSSLSCTPTDMRRFPSMTEKYDRQRSWSSETKSLVMQMEMNINKLDDDPIHLLQQLQAYIYLNNGQIQAAVQLQKELVESRTLILGPSHPGTIASVGFLALINLFNHEWRDADAALVQATGAMSQAPAALCAT